MERKRVKYIEMMERKRVKYIIKEARVKHLRAKQVVW